MARGAACHEGDVPEDVHERDGGAWDTAAAAAVSTERLRKRLQQEGVSEAAIADSERIVREEFEALHKQLVLLKQKQALLLDTLRHLEVLTFI